MIENVLKKISDLSIKSGDVKYSKEQIDARWLGNAPAKLVAIEAAEKSLSVKFPKDYIDFLLITNGFSATRNYTEP